MKYLEKINLLFSCSDRICYTAHYSTRHIVEFCVQIWHIIYSKTNLEEEMAKISKRCEALWWRVCQYLGGKTRLWENASEYSRKHEERELGFFCVISRDSIRTKGICFLSRKCFIVQHHTFITFVSCNYGDLWQRKGQRNPSLQLGWMLAKGPKHRLTIKCQH